MCHYLNYIILFLFSFSLFLSVGEVVILFIIQFSLSKFSKIILFSILESKYWIFPFLLLIKDKKFSPKKIRKSLYNYLNLFFFLHVFSFWRIYVKKIHAIFILQRKRKDWHKEFSPAYHDGIRKIQYIEIMRISILACLPR